MGCSEKEKLDDKRCLISGKSSVIPGWSLSLLLRWSFCMFPAAAPQRRSGDRAPFSCPPLHSYHMCSITVGRSSAGFPRGLGGVHALDLTVPACTCTDPECKSRSLRLEVGGICVWVARTRTAGVPAAQDPLGTGQEAGF